MIHRQPCLSLDGGVPPRPGSLPRLHGCLALLICLLAACAWQRPVRVTLALLGDLSLARGVSPSVDSLAHLSNSLASADLALANLESPLGEPRPGGEAGTNLCAAPEHAPLLAAWGLDLLAIANNHASDCSPDGAQTTRAALAAVNLTSLGAEPLHLQVNHLPLAFLAFDDITAPLDEQSALAAVRLARQQGDLVIVSLHWGMEYQGAPTLRQQRLAAAFAAAGASLLWGHHPHVLQPADWIETDSGRMLVLYSLGNALFDQGGLEDTRQSALVLVSLGAGGVSSAEALPFTIDVPASRVTAPEPADRQEILQRLGLPGR